MSQSKPARRAFSPVALLAGAAYLAIAPAAHSTTSTPTGERNCFFPSQWTNSKAVSPTVIYLRINISDIYKLTLAGSGSYQLLDPTYHLVNVVRGSPTICSAIDLDLRVSSGPQRGFAVPVIAKSLVKLTPAEAAALPKKDRP